MAATNPYKKALWSGVTNRSLFPALTRDIEVDVAIVGGGITGISTAFHLARAGMQVALLEANQVGMGTTGSSTGNLYATTNEHLHVIIEKFDEETMKAVADSRTSAIKFIEERIKEFNIDCEFQRVPWSLFTTEEDAEQIEHVRKEMIAVEKAGLIATNSVPEGFPYQVSSITQVKDQAQFNPLSYVQRLAEGVVGEKCSIFENTKAIKIEDGDPCVIETAGGTVRARKIVQATHTPIGIYAVHTAMEVYRESAYAVRLKGNLPPGGVYWHLKGSQLYSMRPYSNAHGNFLIVLDASHKLGHIEDTEASFRKVEDYMRAHFEIDEIAFSWAAQNYKSADTLPFIGTSPLEKNIYIATGFGPDGLTYGTLSSIIISDLILGKDNPWAKLYDPKRFTPAASFKRFIKENIDVATHLVKDYLTPDEEKNLEEIKANEAKVVKVDGKKVAAFRDKAGKLHVVSAVCTHMGCIVHWNNAERSWDCPCHGSRFSPDGEVLEGPAIQNLAKSLAK